MNRITEFLLMGVFALDLTIDANAQEVKRPNFSYNYQRGVEAMGEEKYDEAKDFFNKDLSDNKNNGYSYSWLSYLYAIEEEYGKAMTAVNQAIKYLPKKDLEYVLFAYDTRSNIYLALGDTLQAINDLNTAIRVKSDVAKLYQHRGDIYYYQDKYNLADADYKKMIELDPGDTYGYMGIGRNAIEQEKWLEAITQFDYVLKLDANFPQAYAFRAESYIGQKKWNEATDDILSALKMDWNNKAMFLATNLEEPAFTTMIAKFKIESAKEPNEPKWPYMMALMYENKEQYKKAIEYYSEANKRSASDAILYRMAYCASEDGNQYQALNYINQAINMDEEDLQNLALKANILYDAGDLEGAIAGWDTVLEKRPDYARGYYRRGWYKRLAGDNDGALEDLTMSIVLDPEFSYPLVVRGEIYLQQGKRELAEEDFKKVVEIEDTPEEYGCLQYAYLGLGQRDKAIEVIDKMISDNPQNKGIYYDAACLYAKMGDPDKALEYLEKSLELGYRSFAHIDRDYDMDSLRELPKFKALIEKYSTHEIEIPVVSQDEIIGGNDIEIPFTKQDGVQQVKCSINDLPLYFIFDTGASVVSLSMVEATFMMKNGYLNSRDVVGSQHFQDANGNISEGTIVNLRKVDFGGQVLENVRASVVRNQKAPLLLGQSVLGRLGKIEIDNSKQVIRIVK